MGNGRKLWAFAESPLAQGGLAVILSAIGLALGIQVLLILGWLLVCLAIFRTKFFEGRKWRLWGDAALCILIGIGLLALNMCTSHPTSSSEQTNQAGSSVMPMTILKWERLPYLLGQPPRVNVHFVYRGPAATDITLPYQVAIFTPAETITRDEWTLAEDRIWTYMVETSAKMADAVRLRVVPQQPQFTTVSGTTLSNEQLNQLKTDKSVLVVVGRLREAKLHALQPKDFCVVVTMTSFVICDKHNN
jgi:hypothetical protein